MSPSERLKADVALKQHVQGEPAQVSDVVNVSGRDNAPTYLQAAGQTARTVGRNASFAHSAQRSYVGL